MAAESIVDAVQRYEIWLRRECDVDEDQLKKKRNKMAKEGPFGFLRATCFRFADQLPALLPQAMDGPRVPSLGDAHLENFGTWRDAEGRLVWGADDLDEAAELPWSFDLIRLATSALLAPGKAAPPADEVAARLLEGYRNRVRHPRPFILDADTDDMLPRANAATEATERLGFWEKLLAAAPAKPPESWRTALLAALPPGAVRPRFAVRNAGLGSRGRPRYVAIADWGGSPVAREAKARVPSVWLLAAGDHVRALDAGWLAAPPNRVPDPWFRLHPGFTIRRLAPDSGKLEAAKGDATALLKLLQAMGGELGNLHAGGRDGAKVGARLPAQDAGWLLEAARTMEQAVRDDHRAWQAHVGMKGAPARDRASVGGRKTKPGRGARSSSRPAPR